MHEAPHHALADDDADEIGSVGLTAWLDDPELAHDLRDARSVLRIELHRLQSAPDEAADGWDCPWPLPEREVSAAVAQLSRGRISGLAWFVLCCGAMLLVCGGVLLALSYRAARPDLWNPGLLSALCGQFLVVLGMVMPRAASGKTRKSEGPTSAAVRLPWRHALGEAAARSA
jgi:hypothetical protein